MGIISAEILPAWTKRTEKKKKIERDGWTPKILLARNRLRKLLHCRCVTCHKIEE